MLRELDHLWRDGRLQELEGDLDRFIRDHLSEIRRTVQEGREGGVEVARRRYMSGEITNGELVDYCVRSFLRRRGSCNPRRDIEEQTVEITRRIRREHEETRVDVPPARREEIVRRWARIDAPKWRERRLYQMLYLWEKRAEEYVRLISPRE